MIERAFVHVGGPPGSGKTTFIEAMLAGVDALTLAARCMRDDTLTQAREGAPRTHPELRRYRQAGAASAAVYTFPGQQSGTDDFFMTNLMMNYSQAIVLEGEAHSATWTSASSLRPPRPGPSSSSSGAALAANPLTRLRAALPSNAFYPSRATSWRPSPG